MSFCFMKSLLRKKYHLKYTYFDEQNVEKKNENVTEKSRSLVFASFVSIKIQMYMTSYADISYASAKYHKQCFNKILKSSAFIDTLYKILKSICNSA